MKRRDAWAALGIDPTDDLRVIRSAYAAKLKAMDPEADSRAFVELREAFETAKASAGIEPTQLAEDAQQPPTHSEPPPVELPGDAASVREAADRAQPPLPAAEVSAKALTLLLYTAKQAHADGNRAARATRGEEQEMRRHWRAIVNDPRMEQLDHYADREGWFAALIASTLPFSEPLVARATLFFRWEQRLEGKRPPPAVGAILWQIQLQRYVEALEKRDHWLHPAWRVLTTPVAEAASGGEDEHLVRELLHIAREDWPGLEAYFDPDAVALRDEPPAAPRPPGGPLSSLAPLAIFGLGALVFATLFVISGRLS